MPCSDDYDDDPRPRRRRPREDEDEGDNYVSRQALLQMLCGLCRRIEEAGRYSLILAKDKDLAKWWKAHKRADAARLKEEQAAKEQKKLAQQALKKLSPKERRALGLT